MEAPWIQVQLQRHSDPYKFPAEKQDVLDRHPLIPKGMPEKDRGTGPRFSTVVAPGRHGVLPQTDGRISVDMILARRLRSFGQFWDV